MAETSARLLLTHTSQSPRCMVDVSTSDRGGAAWGSLGQPRAAWGSLGQPRAAWGMRWYCTERGIWL